MSGGIRNGLCLLGDHHLLIVLFNVDYFCFRRPPLKPLLLLRRRHYVDVEDAVAEGTADLALIGRQVLIEDLVVPHHLVLRLVGDADQVDHLLRLDLTVGHAPVGGTEDVQVAIVDHELEVLAEALQEMSRK